MYDGLNPNDNYFDLPKYRLEYYEKIKEKLYEGLEEDFYVRMLVRPSFDAEYIFQVDRDIRNYEAESFVVRFQKTKSNLWYAEENYKKVNVKKYQAQINKEDAELLTKAFGKVVQTTRYERNDLLMFDGTNYLLSTFVSGMGEISGNVQSPDGNEIKELIDVVENLINQTKSKRNIKLSEEAKNTLTNIIKQTEKNPTSADYELMSRIVKVIENNKESYCSKLTESNRLHVEDALQVIQDPKQFAYYNFDKSTLKNFIKEIEDDFIEFNTFDKDSKNEMLKNGREIENEENIKNNIFQLILKEFG
ncbi:hypothetical protein NU10_13460 [Flavobacterium dauae]|uniref:hypothetical protein n=1 Tax=Flavobacterium dauae TaxID=1563479 RepID=UPI00101B4B61|nr:hypothetical protein [Flavobacterium dauae]WLD23695.1 hypothetical protein NU10_13460 [Flavobacterium dauae]